MARKSKPKVIIGILFILFVLGGIGLVVGYLSVTTAVNRQFGSPAKNLTLTQRLAYPMELFLHRESFTSPTDPAADEINFEISQGESISLVCLRLEQAGLIDDAELFRMYLIYSGLDRQLQSGQFRLSAAMSPLQIASDLLDATPTEAIVTVLPGWRIEEVAANVAGSGMSITAEAFINAAYEPSSEYLSYLPVGEVPSLEGFLFPGTYVISRDANLDMIFEVLLTAFDQNVDSSILDGFARQGLSIYEGVTLASIIEKEAVVDEEKPLMASVFFNRLESGIRLETDPTVQYSLGYQTATQSWWKSPLALTDLVVDSPYNTYKIFGLPPTPISNPDLNSLRAVAFPAETPYYYFRAACDGSGRHKFAITFEEHLNNGCE